MELGDIINLLPQLLYIVFFVFIMFFGQKIQLAQISAMLERGLLMFKILRNETFEVAVKHIEEIGKGKNTRRKIKFFLDYITVIPNDIDPAKIVDKFEHVFNVREYYWEQKVKEIAPKANVVQRKNIENILEGLFGVNYYYKVARHFFLLGKKTNNAIFLMQAQMLIPMLFGEAKSYRDALDAFIIGCPIGDGIGCYVASRFMEGHKSREVAKETVMAVFPFKKRTLYVIKAKGPYGTCGNPDKVICDVIKNHVIRLAIMIDAGLKFEGEQRGQVIAGAGAAIGGFGHERFRIEEAVTKYEIPLYCWIVKESLRDAITAMRKEIMDSTDIVMHEIITFILKETKEGDNILIAGIGNTMGVGNG